ncbi:hypothetical protein SNARM312S_01384 [Streptomyces narbonensis]
MKGIDGPYAGADRAGRVVALGGGDGDGLQAAEGEDGRDHADGDAVPAVREETAVAGEVRDAG